MCFELRHCFDKEGMCVLSPVCITETKHLMWPISDFLQVFHHSAHLLYTKYFPLNSIQSYSHTVLFHITCISWAVDKLLHGAVIIDGMVMQWVRLSVHSSRVSDSILSSGYRLDFSMFSQNLHGVSSGSLVSSYLDVLPQGVIACVCTWCPEMDRP